MPTHDCRTWHCDYADGRSADVRMDERGRWELTIHKPRLQDEDVVGHYNSYDNAIMVAGMLTRSTYPLLKGDDD